MLTDELTNEDKSTLFKKAFDMVVPAAEKWDFEDDFFSYFIETVKELIMPTGEMDTEQEESCPYCDGTPQKISKGEFFGPRSAEGEGYVWGCECGAYAVMSDDGEVHGKLGDTLLHQKRNLLKGAICELCILAGMTSYESYRWFSIITGQRLNSAADVEYLDLDACNIALRIFICIKQKIQNTEYNYNTMNSWNQSTSYANNVKVYSLGLTKEQEDKLYAMLETSEFYTYINDMLNEFSIEHNHLWQVGFNGRSSGYLVLYQGFSRLSGYKSFCRECGQRNYKTVEETGNNRCGRCGADARINFETMPEEVGCYPGRSTDILINSCLHKANTPAIQKCWQGCSYAAALCSKEVSSRVVYEGGGSTFSFSICPDGAKSDRKLPCIDYDK